MPDTQRTLEEILNLAATQFKVPRENLAPDDDFFKTLGIDSLQALDLLTRLERLQNASQPDTSEAVRRGRPGVSARQRP